MFVLDASVALAWCFPDESTLYVDAVRDSLRSARAFVPVIWPLEVTNVLLVGERRKRLTQEQGTRFIRLLRALPITIDGDEAHRRFLHETHALARSTGLSSYDAAYLDLALVRDIPLATLDEKLSLAAMQVGVPLFLR